MNQNEVLNEKTIRLKLLMCSGSEDFYIHPLFKSIRYTDGISLMVELCKANWLLIDVLANLTLLKSRYSFIIIKLLKLQGEDNCSLVFEDGNNNPVRKPIHYSFSDFPLSNWKNPEEKKDILEPSVILFFSNDVLYLPSEH